MAAILDHLNKRSFPHRMEAPYEIWLWLAQRFLRRTCLKSECGRQKTNDRWRRPTYPISSPVSLWLRWAKNPDNQFVYSDLKTTRSALKASHKYVRSLMRSYGPRQANLVLIAYASSEGSGEPAHPRSLARTFAARSYKQWVKRNLQTESQIPCPSEWLGMRS